MLLVSIIVPVFNSEKYLPECIQSILNQTYKYFELILVDDGSTDNSLSICSYFSNIDKRVKVISQENSGAPIARNKGLFSSNGSYVMFFDSDDIMVQNCLETMISAISKNNIDLCIANYETFSNSTKKIRYKNFNKRFNSKSSYCYIDPFPGTKLIKKQVLLENNLTFANLKIGQDLNFYLKYLYLVNQIVLLDDSLCFYRLRDNSISHKVGKNILGIIDTFEDLKMFYEENSIINKDYYCLFFIHLTIQMRKVLDAKNKSDKNLFFTLKNKANQIILEVIKSLNSNNYERAIKHIGYNLLIRLLFFFK